MAKLTDDEQAQLDKLQAKLDAADEPAGGGSSRVENVNITIDLDNEVQVKRAVKSGLLPKSYLDDDEDDDDDEDGDDDDAGRSKKAKPDPQPRRTLDRRYA